MDLHFGSTDMPVMAQIMPTTVSPKATADIEKPKLHTLDRNPMSAA